MKKLTQIHNLLLIIMLLYGCATVPQLEMYESVPMTGDESMEIESQIEIPVVELFISAPFQDESEDKIIDTPQVSMPVEDVPELVIEEINEIAVNDTITVSNIAEKVQPLSESIEVINSEPVVEETQIVTESNEIIEDKSEKATYEELTIASGEDLLIKLESEGWIFDNSNSPSAVKLKKREFKNNQTWFLFSINDSGIYQLGFNLQNLSNGNEENAQYQINIESPSESVDTPIIIDPLSEEELFENDEESDIALTIEEENIPELVSSFEDLFDDELPLDSTQLSEAFELLEKQGGYDQYLVELAEYVFKTYPYDNISAELLYKAAQSIEKPGPMQNIEKALSIFKQVRDYFPISIYCDKSEERIRYLERHFMKIY